MPRLPPALPRVCKLCGVMVNKGSEIPVKDYIIVIDKAVAATYAKTGKTESSHCSICSAVIKAQKTVVMKKLTQAKITSITNTSTGITVKWNKVTSATAYQVYRKIGTGSWKLIKTMYRLNRPTLSRGTKNIATKKIVVKWNKNTKATGYQVKYVKGSTTKTVKVKGAASLSKTLSSLAKGSTYKVSVCSYKTVSGTTYYSAYSAVKSVKAAK